ncbi:MAG: DUF5681 domain-containing protein [Methylocella sp.]
MPENAIVKQTWGLQKRQSGNPAGKPKGARHKTTLTADRLMQDDVGEIANAVITAALKGDMMAAKIILDRIAPVRRSRRFDLPRVEGSDDVAGTRAAVLGGVAGGALTPGDAADVFRLIDRTGSGLAARAKRVREAELAAAREAESPAAPQGGGEDAGAGNGGLEALAKALSGKLNAFKL